MLHISIPPFELYDEQSCEFISVKETTVLSLEHSLVSVSKWESKWCVPFMTNSEKTFEQTMDYIRCMNLTPDVDPKAYLGINEENIKKINEYISAPMSATTFPEDNTKGKSRETVTSELIYYWMIGLNVPLECENWHLNRLITLIKVCELKNKPPKKHSKREIMARNSALNAARRKQLHTTG